MRPKEIREKDSINLGFGTPVFFETIYEEIVFEIKNECFSEIVLKEKVNRVLAKVGFRGDLKKSPFRLSGGEKRKIVLASILILELVFLILDEPMVGFDESGYQIMYTIINDYRRLSPSVIIISHDLDFLYQVVDRFILLEAGSLTADFFT